MWYLLIVTTRGESRRAIPACVSNYLCGEVLCHYSFRSFCLLGASFKYSYALSLHAGTNKPYRRSIQIDVLMPEQRNFIVILIEQSFNMIIITRYC